ncbi:MAG: hypothetical protein IKU36_13180 [Bacteroidales bacterium]|nr:hypothetical protein [Bacteroidales bacterium]
MKEPKFAEYCRERDISFLDISKQLDISPFEAWQRFKGHEDFTLREIKTLCEKYGLSAEEYFC